MKDSGLSRWSLDNTAGKTILHRLYVPVDSNALGGGFNKPNADTKQVSMQLSKTKNN